MPCLNEAETLPTCIQKAQEVIHKHDLQAEIEVADLSVAYCYPY